MKISELQPRMRNIELEAEITDIGEVREFQKFGDKGRVVNATIKDDSGQVALTLWNDQIDQVSVGDKIKLENCYVNEWQGEMQVTTGRSGTITKI